ncbi:MAG: hypothetical protein V5B36_03185 [Candidatus Accumulibacter sp. UW25]
MEFSIENVTALVKKAYLVHARTAFGDAGTEGIIALLDTVKLIFQKCPPESLPGTLTVVKGINATPLSPVIAVLGLVRSVSTHDALGRLIHATTQGTHTFVETLSDGTFRVLTLSINTDLQLLAQNALVYRFEADTDQILAKEYRDFVPKVSPFLKSNFAVPTLASLEAAIERYASEEARESRCKILASVWEGGVDGPRLVLANKPEALMRDSLAQALRFLTRDTNVRPEQNTDETKPVDIRVEWFGSGASALIEVKWLGKSTARSRIPGSNPTYTTYGTQRAQDGADQLADYMDREVRHSNASAPRGYLVIFDARRKNVEGANDPISKEDALFYENDTLSFNPDHSRTRRDFAPPLRFYMKPRESHFAPA